MTAAIAAFGPSLPRRQPHEAPSPPSEHHQGPTPPGKPNVSTDQPAMVHDQAAAVSSLLKTTVLRASPYAGPEHLLHLDNLDNQNRLMALALSCLVPARPDYATADYQQAFAWDQVFALLATMAREQRVAWKKQSFYVVEFRSKLKENIDNDRLYLLDKQSHMEASASGGLLKYWYGSPDSERYNLATCLWRSKEDAVDGGRGPWHKQARAVIPQMYDMIQVKGLSLTIDDDIKSWDFNT